MPDEMLKDRKRLMKMRQMSNLTETSFQFDITNNERG